MNAEQAKIRDRVVLLLVNGMGVEQAEKFCMDEGGVGKATAGKIVTEARKKITVAAGYSRMEEVGKSVRRLNDLYGRSLAGQDGKTALQAQREINRLLGLYATNSTAEVETEGAGLPELQRRLDLISGHLLPLKLAEPQHPLEEHARMAADLISSSGLAKRT